MPSDKPEFNALDIHLESSKELSRISKRIKEDKTLQFIYKFIQSPDSEVVRAVENMEHLHSMLHYIRCYIIFNFKKKKFENGIELELATLRLTIEISYVLSYLLLLPSPLDDRQESESLVVVSSYHRGTRGHIMATSKLINFLRQKLPYIKLDWFIVNGYDDDLSFIDCELAPKSYTSVEELLLAPGNAELIQQADEVLQFPAFYKSTDLEAQFYHAVSFLRHHEFPSYTTMLEYGFETMAGYMQEDRHKMRLLTTGFEAGSWGIFIEPQPDTVEPQLLLNSLSDVVKEAIGTESYMHEHTLFLGYRAALKDIQGDLLPKTLNSTDFIHIIAGLNHYDAAVMSKSVIDVVTPIETSELSQLNDELLRNNGIKDVVVIKNKEVVETRCLGQSGKTLRILDLYPIDYADMKRLMQLAHPFVMCTGDQSLSEVLSKCNPEGEEAGIPFYQTVPHKEPFLQSMLQLVENKLKNQDALVRYLKLITNPAEVKQNSQEFAALVASEELKQDMKSLQQHLREHCNLYTWLYKKIPKMMHARFSFNFSSSGVNSFFAADTKNHYPEKHLALGNCGP